MLNVVVGMMFFGLIWFVVGYVLPVLFRGCVGATFLVFSGLAHLGKDEELRDITLVESLRHSLNSDELADRVSSLLDLDERIAGRCHDPTED